MGNSNRFAREISYHLSKRQIYVVWAALLATCDSNHSALDNMSEKDWELLEGISKDLLALVDNN